MIKNFSDITSDLYFEFSKLADCSNSESAMTNKVLKKMNFLLYKRFKRDSKLLMKQENYNIKLDSIIPYLNLKSSYWKKHNKKLYSDCLKRVEVLLNENDVITEEVAETKISVPSISVVGEDISSL